MSRYAYRYRGVPSTAPVEMPDTDAAFLFEQVWRRRDGQQTRKFTVLALDEQMAEEMGGLRLSGKYDQNVMQWTLASSRRCERLTSQVFAALHAEDPDETKLREETFMRREAGEPSNPDPNGVSASERMDAGYDALNARRR